jgi:protein O-GlcNAc transferase
MLKWLATRFERGRSRLQSHFEKSLMVDAGGEHPMTSSDWRKRGNQFLDRNLLNDAQVCYRRGIQVDPSDAACFVSLGFVLGEMERFEESQAALLRAIALDANDFESHYMLGNLASKQAKPAMAIEHYQSALRIHEDFEICRRDLCITLAKFGRTREARKTLDEGSAFPPNSHQLHFFSGNLHLAEGEVVAAVADFQSAASLSVQDADILLNLGVAQFRLRDVYASLATYQRILEFDPMNVQAHANIAAVYQMMGKLDLAVASYRRALEIEPGYLNAHQNLVYALTYYPKCSSGQYLEEAMRYGAKIRALAKRYSDWHSPPYRSEIRSLRIGFVSGDLRSHPVGEFLEGVLAHIDPAKLSLIAYSNSVKEDELSVRIKPLFAQWTVVTSMPDHQLAEKIHADKIDILIDLAGHTENSRLSVFAWKPAPVQVSWLGYWASTGLLDLDYILVDEVSVPPDEQPFFSEKLWYLPQTRLCLTPPNDSAGSALTEPPALRNGFVTYGSYQSLTKMGDGSLSAWSRVLAEEPTARLRLQNWEFRFPEAVEDMRQRLLAAHIDVLRVDMHGGADRDAYFGSYAEVDLVLDTFPFPGGTTTAEAVWMGVPTVTLAGASLVARQGVSMLHCVGLQDFIANSEAEYVALAVQHARQLDRLAEVRAELRSKAQVSPLFNAALFARNLERVLIEMMEKYESGTKAGPALL